MTQLDLFAPVPDRAARSFLSADPTPTYDAVLRVGRLAGDYIQRSIRGRVYGDTLTTGNHPFADGTPVITSPAVSYIDDILLTQSGTRYLIEIDQ